MPLRFGKLIAPVSDEAEGEIVELSSSSWSPDPYGRTPLTAACHISSVDGSAEGYSDRGLLDTGCTAYTVIDESLAERLCEQLQIEPVPLAQARPLRAYNGQLAPKPITHAIYPTLAVNGHSEQTCPMLIVPLGNHRIIIGKPWMNKHGVILDMKYDRLVYKSNRCTHSGATFNVTSKEAPEPAAPVIKETPKYTVLKRKKPALSEAATKGGSKDPTVKGPINQVPDSPTAMDEGALDIAPISAAAFYRLNSRTHRKKGVKCFSLTISAITEELLRRVPHDGENCLELKALSEMTMEQVLQKLPEEFHDLKEAFDRSKANELPPHRPYDHKIEVEGGESQMPKSRVYHMSTHKLLETKKYLEENLKKGFISPSTAPYASPVLFAAKPNGGLRFCVDYRKLNAITRRNRYPIPLIEETLARVLGCKYLTKLDIIAAFNKLRMHPESEDLTTFVTSMGAYKYHVLPFGLTNGPASYQHYMNDVLFEYLNDFVQAYLDDILIYSKTRKEHTRHVRLVLQKLIDAGLQVDIAKSQFYVQETSFLGVLLSTEGIRMDPAKVQVVIAWATPTCLKEVQAFVGFCNFYRRFIRGFSKIVRPMLKLTQKDIPFSWSEACQKAFELLKEQITQAPVLRHFDRLKKAVLETDSSDYVNGGVLSQYDDEGNLHPVAFYSKNLLPAECNYEIYDKELLAIIRCFEHWRPDLEATEIPVEVFTDHKNLEYFMTSKELTRRQARWAEKLSEYNFKIMYQSGTKNAKADALTRRAGDTPTSAQDDRLQYQHQTILTPERLEINDTEIDPEVTIFDRVRAANTKDEACTQIRGALNKGKKHYQRIPLDQCSIREGALYHQDKLWVPNDPSILVPLLREVHDQPASGHPGIHRTIELLRRNYYWPNMRKEVDQYIRNCYSCHGSKAPRDKYNGLLVPASIPTQRWTDITMDFITGLPDSDSCNAICTIVDKLTRERHYEPCTATDEGTSAEATAEILIRGVFRYHGLPTTITSDRGPQFVSAVWKCFCKILGIKSKLSTAWHPPTDGQSERANQDVERQLRTYCNYMQDDWKKWLPMAEFADNNALSSGTGMSPFFANKGYHPRMSFTPDATNYSTARERLAVAKAEDISGTMRRILDLMQKNSAKAQEAMSKQANKRRKEVSYEVGDKAFLSSRNITTDRPSKKLEDKMLGPFEVTEKVGTSYKLQIPHSMRVHDSFHTDLLRKDPGDPLPGQIQEPPGVIITPEGDEWDLDDIENSRWYYGRLQYRCKWTGQKQRDMDWYYADSGEFKNAPDIVNDYHSRYINAPGSAGDPRPPGRRTRTAKT